MKKWLKKLANNLKTAPKMPTVIGFAYWALINVLFTHSEALYKLSIDKTSLLAVAQFEVASLICAVVLANLIARIIRKAKTDALYRKFLKRAVIYFAISIAFLLLVYPGLYQFDDTEVIAAAQSYQVSAWQHFFSSLHDSMSLMLVPLACAPIIFHCFWTALTAAYVSSFLPPVLAKNAKKQKYIGIALFAIFFLPAVVLYTLTGYRVAIYRLLEVFIIVYLYIHYKKQQKISNFAMLSLSFVIILAASWRTEGIYYIVCMPIILLIMRKPILTIKQIAFFSIFIALTVLNISKFNTKLIGTNYYTLGALMTPITGIIDGAIEENDTETLDFYNSLFEIDCIKRNNFRKMPEYIFWRCANSRSPELINKAISETIKIAPKYISYIAPLYGDIACDTILGVRCGPYNTGQSGVTPVSDFAIYYFSDEIEEYAPGTSFESMIDLPAKHPINRNLRASVANLLTGRFADTEFKLENVRQKAYTDPNAIPVYYQIFYTLIIPIIAIIAAIIQSIRRKKWLILILSLFILIRVPVVIIGSMAAFLMYLMPFYISALVLFIIAFFEDKKID